MRNNLNDARCLVILSFILIQSATSLLNSHYRRSLFLDRSCIFKYNGLVSKLSDSVSASSHPDELNESLVEKKLTKTAVSAEKRAKALRATQAAAEIALETNKIFNDDKETENEDSGSVKAVTKKGRKAVKPKLPTPRERTGLNFTGRDKATGDLYEYDVPFIDTPRWYRILVRKNSERKVCDSFLKVSEKESSRWYNVMIDSFYPKLHSVRFKSSESLKRVNGERPKELATVSTPMVPGVIYIKCVMSPDIAEDLEAIMNIRGLVKDSDGLVLPLDAEEEEQIELLKEETAAELPPEADLLRIGEYVSIVSGRHEGKYGIIQGASNGKISVLIRTEYKDYQDTFEVSEVRHLSNPPEKNYKTLTPKEAVEALMLKEPNSEMLRYLKKEGLLSQILNPDAPISERGRASGGGDRQERRGREGGASMRSIAKVQQGGPSPTFSRAQDVIGRPTEDLSDFFESLGGSEEQEEEGADDVETPTPRSAYPSGADQQQQQQPKIRSWSPKSPSGYSSPNPNTADSVKVYPPKWGSTNNNDDYASKTNSYNSNKGDNSRREKKRDNNNYKQSDYGDSKFGNSFSEGGGGLGYEDYRRMTSSTTNTYNNAKINNKDQSENNENFDSFLEQILKEVDSSVEQRLAGPSTNDFSSNDDDDLDLGWLDNLDGETSPTNKDERKARQLDNADSEAVLDDLIKELKFNPPSRKKAPTSGRNWDSPSNSNSKGNSRSPVTAASRSSGTWNKGDSKPGEAPIVPNADQFESFEDYLNALVSYEKGGHSGERKWFKSEKEVVVPASSTKQTDQGTKESFDSFFEALIPTSESPTRKTKPPVVASPPSPTSNNEGVSTTKDLNSLTVKDLKDQLKERGLKLTGNKAELISRLSEPQ